MTSKIQNWDFLILNWEQMDHDTLIIQYFFHSESLAQWQSVRLVIWRSLVQTLAVPIIFFSFIFGIFALLIQVQTPL